MHPSHKLSAGREGTPMTYAAPFVYALNSLSHDAYASVPAQTPRRRRRRRVRALTVARP
jgi:hypothetical protein